jgi:hypothetical protein
VVVVGDVGTDHAPGWGVPGLVEVEVVIGCIVVGTVGVTIGVLGVVIVTVLPWPTDTLTPTGVVLVEVDVGAVVTAVVTVGAVLVGAVEMVAVGLEVFTG